jgi:predicted DNA-binding protein YlxM (UPF0122 family)
MREYSDEKIADVIAYAEANLEKTYRQVADACNVQTELISNLIKDGRLPHRFVSRREYTREFLDELQLHIVMYPEETLTVVASLYEMPRGTLSSLIAQCEIWVSADKTHTRFEYSDTLLRAIEERLNGFADMTAAEIEKEYHLPKGAVYRLIDSGKINPKGGAEWVPRHGVRVTVEKLRSIEKRMNDNPHLSIDKIADMCKTSRTSIRKYIRLGLISVKGYERRGGTGYSKSILDRVTRTLNDNPEMSYAECDRLYNFPSNTTSNLVERNRIHPQILRVQKVHPDEVKADFIAYVIEHAELTLKQKAENKNIPYPTAKRWMQAYRKENAM